MLARKRQEKFVHHILSIPFIYGVFFAFVILDILMEIYHRVCFPLFDIPYVKRSEYIRIDRGRLPYLNTIEKLNCMYCGYGNGLLAYATEIAARTEQYWCSIKHENDPGKIFYPPDHHTSFLEYGDQGEFDRFLEKK